jgi:hypothetical protein
MPKVLGRKGFDSTPYEATILAVLKINSLIISALRGLIETSLVGVGSMRLLVFVFSAMTLFGVSSGALAKDLSQRMGVGYSDQWGIGESMPSVSVRYYPNNQYGLQASVGVDTQKDAERFGVSAKFIKIVFREDNMNFYVAAGGGLVSRQQGSTDSGFDAAAVFGGEFFLPGLESLGFNFEGGFGVTSISSDMRFRTVGDSPLKAGMFFYF